MKFYFVFIVFCFAQFCLGESLSNVNGAGVILDGYDVVSYFKPNGPIKGKSQFQITFEENKYWFSSEDNKAEFLKEPKKYSPQFGGWCAFAVADSKSKVEVDPKSYLIQDGKLLLFYNGLWGDTKKKWQSSKEKTPAIFLKDAERNWPEVSKQTP